MSLSLSLRLDVYMIDEGRSLRSALNVIVVIVVVVVCVEIIIRRRLWEHTRLAQRTAHWTSNPKVQGSSPWLGVIFLSSSSSSSSSIRSFVMVPSSSSYYHFLLQLSPRSNKYLAVLWLISIQQLC